MSPAAANRSPNIATDALREALGLIITRRALSRTGVWTTLPPPSSGIALVLWLSSD
jgi:hypothetical protein